MNYSELSHEELEKSTWLSGELRHLTFEHLNKAKELLAKDDYQSVRYACLELRTAIEYLSYSKMAKYLDQLPYSIVDTWQPAKVIRTLKQFDPHVEASGTLRIFTEKKDGTPDKLSLEGDVKSYTARWASEAHNSLGSFLHASKLSKIKQPPTKEKMKGRLIKVIGSIDEILNARFHNFVMQSTVSCKCLAQCGATIKRDIESIPENGEVACPNPDCRIYHIVEIANDKVSWKLKPILWGCPECKSENYFDNFHYTDPVVLNCESCSAQLVLYKDFRLMEIKEYEKLYKTKLKIKQKK